MLSAKSVDQFFSYLDRQELNKAKKVIELHTRRKNNPADSLLVAFFQRALLRRLNGNEWASQNAYLESDSEQLEVFNIMAKEFPVVKDTHTIATSFIVEKILKLPYLNEKKIILLDVGIGSGKQVAEVIKQLAKKRVHLPEFVVVGIDPSLSPEKNNKALMKTLEQTHQLRINYIEIAQPIETLEQALWQKLETLVKNYGNEAKVFINASYSLHHIPQQRRQQVMQQLCALKPLYISITEPHANLISSNPRDIYENAWQHYQSTFSAIDTMAVSDAIKAKIKTVFFAQEIEDLFSGHIVEAYETAEMWLSRFKAFSYRPFPFKSLRYEQALSNLECKNHGYYVSVGLDKTPLVSFFALRPN
jgi:hypothetical protein